MYTLLNQEANDFIFYQLVFVILLLMKMGMEIVKKSFKINEDVTLRTQVFVRILKDFEESYFPFYNRV